MARHYSNETRAYNKRYASDHLNEHRLWSAARREERRCKIRELKASFGCLHCRERDPDCLDFHHVDKVDKLFAICVAVGAGAGRSWDSILKEINKCIVLCANCHRKEEARARRTVIDKQRQDT